MERSICQPICWYPIYTITKYIYIYIYIYIYVGTFCLEIPSSISQCVAYRCPHSGLDRSSHPSRTVPFLLSACASWPGHGRMLIGTLLGHARVLGVGSAAGPSSTRRGRRPSGSTRSPRCRPQAERDHRAAVQL